MPITPIESRRFCSHGKAIYGDDCPQCELLWENMCLRNAEDSVARHKANIDALLTAARTDGTPEGELDAAG